MLTDFFRKPYGVGASLNVFMFTPSRLWHAIKLLVCDPRYFLNRIAVLVHQLLHAQDPWLTRDAVLFLDRHLSRDMRGFEWGSGRSTIWFAKRIGALVSIEDNEQWYERLRSIVVGLGVDYRLVPGDSGAYASQIQQFPDAFFDFILVDGMARDACIAAAADKIKAGGIIVVDNADSNVDLGPLATFACRRTSNGVWRTDIFTRTETDQTSLQA